MMENTRERQLPVRWPPHSDELLSSWIGRHASFYAVPPLVMPRLCLPEVPSLRSADLHLSDAHQIRLANRFAIEPAVLRRMTFASAPRLSHRLIAARPAQICASCSPHGAEPTPIPRSQLAGWRITCPHRGALLRGLGDGELPPLAGNIAVRLIVAKSCSTMKQNVVLEPGHRQPTLLGFSDATHSNT